MDIPIKKYTGIVLQVMLMYGFYWIGTWIQSILHLPLTGSIVGMLLLFIVIQMGWVRISWGNEGSSWLQSNLQLLFIPPTVGIINHFDFFYCEYTPACVGIDPQYPSNLLAICQNW